jgi:demethoxyubiquinone hydroxylase (CLK1/Coq7/Cat5 family)
MEKITCAAELKIAIRNLEFEQEVQGQLLKEHFFLAFDSLKPANLIKNTLQDITSSPYLLDNMLGSVMGMFTGFISKKIAVGASHNLFRKMAGSLLQFGVTNLVAQNSDILKSVGNFIIDRIRHRKEKNIEKA